MRSSSVFARIASKFSAIARAPPVVEFGDQTGDVARPVGGAFERLVEQGREAREALFEIVALAVERGHQRHRARCAVRSSAPSVRRLLRSTSATASASARPCESNWPASRCRSVSVCVVTVRKLEMLLVDLAVRHAGLGRDVVHGGDEIRHARDQRLLDLAHVLVRAARAPPAAGCWPRAGARTARWCPSAACRGFPASRTRRPTRSASTARPRPACVSCSSRKVRAMVLAAPCVASSALSRRSLTAWCTDALVACVGGALGGLQFLERARDGAGAGFGRLVDQPRDVLAVVHHGLREGEALGLDRLHRMVGDAAHFAGELLALRRSAR